MFFLNGFFDLLGFVFSKKYVSGESQIHGAIFIQFKIFDERKNVSRIVNVGWFSPKITQIVYGRWAQK